jgi:hypothetical protein
MEDKIKDEWDIALDKQLAILKTCQSEKQLNGCEKCPQIIECETRKAYVKAVYESMSKGSSGGFEF